MLNTISAVKRDLRMYSRDIREKLASINREFDGNIDGNYIGEKAERIIGDVRNIMHLQSIGFTLKHRR